jgi:hypothetical protein
MVTFSSQQDLNETLLPQIARNIATKGKLIVITGAGISVSSGIPVKIHGPPN